MTKVTGSQVPEGFTSNRGELIPFLKPADITEFHGKFYGTKIIPAKNGDSICWVVKDMETGESALLNETAVMRQVRIDTLSDGLEFFLINYGKKKSKKGFNYHDIEVFTRETTVED